MTNDETLTAAHMLTMEWIVARANEGQFDANAASNVILPVIGAAVRAFLNRSAVDQLAAVGEDRGVLAEFTNVLKWTTVAHANAGRFPPSVAAWIMDPSLIDAVVHAFESLKPTP